MYFLHIVYVYIYIYTLHPLKPTFWTTSLVLQWFAGVCKCSRRLVELGHVVVTSSRLQSFTCVSSSGPLATPSMSLDCCPPLPCNPLRLSPSSGLLCPPLPSNPLRLPPTSALLCPPLNCIPFPLACNPLHLSPSLLPCPSGLRLAIRNMCLPTLLPALGCCVRLWLAILYTCLPALGLCAAVCNPLHLSPSSRLLYPPLPCNPFFVTQLLVLSPLQVQQGHPNSARGKELVPRKGAQVL